MGHFHIEHSSLGSVPLFLNEMNNKLSVCACVCLVGVCVCMWVCTRACVREYVWVLWKVGLASC